jgi:very-long-chain enoyl-CoA reductase
MNKLSDFVLERLLRNPEVVGTPKGAGRYLPPVGGLFPQVAAPHYLFELVAWFGIACVAQQVNAFLVFGTMAAYLTARALNTNDFYKSKFGPEEWPRTKKALIPGLF